MFPRSRAVAAVAAAAVTLAVSVGCGSDDEVTETLQTFLDGWPTGDLGDLAFITPTGESVPSAEVADGLAGLAGDLAEHPPTSRIGDVSVTDGVATAQVAVSWPLSAAEEAPTWDFSTTVRLSEGDDTWRVIWEPAVLHPDLQTGDTLAVQRERAPRGEILDADGNPIMTVRDVVDVGIWEAQATDLDADLDTLDAALRSIDVEIDMAALQDRIDATDPDQFVPAVTLRRSDYDTIRDRIRDLGATTFHERERHLAPTATFARAVLGIVDQATAEVIEESQEVYAAGDQVGYGGLSEAFDAQLRGTPGRRVVTTRTDADGEVSVAGELHLDEPVAGSDLTTTLDVPTQEAAEEALHTDDRRAALVAVRVSDGTVRAVANTHGAEANPVDLALTAAVPPGSTFKLVSAYAFLSTGEVELDTMVDCPRELSVEGRTFHNADHFALGEVTFLTNVARSCNTAFAALAPRLGDNGLAAAAAELGIGGEWDLGPETFTGEVSSGGDAVERAAASFGQGTTVVSPAAMAAATAAVARGEWLPPTLVTGSQPRPDPTPLPSGAVEDLHTALREVVTDGTATALADVPDPDVYGKTGTAEAGEQTHGWFIGWRDDLAFAVFVEDGGSGSGAAVPLAERFLRNLG